VRFPRATRQLFQEDPAGDGPVEHLSQGELGLHDGDVVVVAFDFACGDEVYGNCTQLRPPCHADVRQPVDQGILFLDGHEERSSV
jgi:hypothetical protein